MCFHTKLTKEEKKLEEKFKAVFDFDFEPNSYYNGFSFPKTPIITNEDRCTIQMINWGLVPSWANEDWNKTYTLNARIETLEEKPSFKNILDNRCIVIVDGFYEWQHIGKQKIKYEIGFDNELFAFAGLYDENNGYKSYTIITTEAKGIMREIHNSKLRMPISFNTDEQINKWLDNNLIEESYNFTSKSLDNIQQQLF